MIHEENGQIIVDELRPMSDLLEDCWAIYFDKDHHSFEGKNYGLYVITASDERIKKYDLIGWLPMPTYRKKDGM